MLLERWEDPDLSERGKRYAIALSEFVNLHSSEDHLSVWTSTLQRTIQTAKPLKRHCIGLRALDEIDAGICDGLTYAEVAEQYPNGCAARTTDKLRYRYPRGESYEDVIDRLDPLIIELERQEETVLVVAHQAVLRALYGYFAGRNRSEVPHIDMPLHTIIALTPKAYGCNERRLYCHPVPFNRNPTALPQWNPPSLVLLMGPFPGSLTQHHWVHPILSSSVVHRERPWRFAPRFAPRWAERWTDTKHWGPQTAFL